jgi:hypothetical protein
MLRRSLLRPLGIDWTVRSSALRRVNWGMWGWPAAAGILAGVLGLGLSLAAAPHWLAQAQALQKQSAVDAQRQRQLMRSLPSTTTTTTPTKLPEWPLAAQSPQRVADVLVLAARHGVSVDRAQQRLDKNSGGLQLNLTARGGYAELRSFVAYALVGDPHLALQSLRLQRRSPAAAELQADLQWLLLQRAAAADGAGS